MGQRKTLGGDRLGAGRQQKVDTKTFNRSNFDLGYVWRSTMSAGTLVPFMCEVAITADSFDIELGCEVLTLPTLGPLFGSMKVQLDIFTAPVRLYQGQLHNNKLGIGLNMASVKLPRFALTAPRLTEAQLIELIATGDIDNSQINPSSILSYLGIRGIGIPSGETDAVRHFNAVPFLAYWDIVKQYYANKQEEDAWVIHTPPMVIDDVVTDAEVTGTGNTGPIPEYPTLGTPVELALEEIISLTTTAQLNPQTVMIGLQSLTISGGIDWVPLSELTYITVNTSLVTEGTYKIDLYGVRSVITWRYKNNTDLIKSPIELTSFPLENIDMMREAILAATLTAAPFDVDLVGIPPYSLIFEVNGAGTDYSIMGNQEGLAVKTYQSDLLNNWLNTEAIDGVNGIAAVTAVSTVGDEFRIDALILHKKVYEMLNDILVSGGTYDDWNEVVYDHVGITRAESPIYWGSLIKELHFQEVVSNSASSATGGVQPLGELAGRGRLGNKHKGGKINVKTDEISYLIGIVSITPRLDYSQGNEWHVGLETMDDYRKPHLDGIGFQELMTGQMAWWNDAFDTDGNLVQFSAGKQTAWINYQTNVNRIKGNFAIPNDSMFMVLTRRYQAEHNVDQLIRIADVTTYIDPRHFNHIFAQTSLDSQNYWVNIGVDMMARRKMSARQMPTL